MNNMNYNKNKYNEFNNILSGCKTIVDAYYFGDIYIKYNPEMNALVKSMIHGKKYDVVLSFNNMMTCINSINKYIYKDEIEEITDNYMKKTNDVIQLKTIKRFISRKQIRKNINTHNYTHIKKCPHCNYKEMCTNNYKMSYVICGYMNENTGYDWNGCGKDWCYTCCKKLCKTWSDDKLYEIGNRTHNNICCYQKAKNNNEDYLNVYCQCSNKYVDRNDKTCDSEYDEYIDSDYDIKSILSDMFIKK